MFLVLFANWYGYVIKFWIIKSKQMIFVWLLEMLISLEGGFSNYFFWPERRT